MQEQPDHDVPEKLPLPLTMSETSDFESHPGIMQMLCPRCRGEYVHAVEHYYVQGYDEYCAWEGRGHVLRVQWYCESGHAWEVCFGFHKGQTYCWLEDIPIPDDDEEVWPWGPLRDAKVRAITRAQTFAEIHYRQRKEGREFIAAKGIEEHAPYLHRL